ncbi:hypothetical protein EDB81DRAFT_914163 [Dactylonectria macrodidyma]|uniref:Short-chain dehydrogenase/reductase 3 n=1 Tax=Dactylonectria macrodidyma TaxID=307937 RepID=A0A9P9DJU5_9HYPO|nr:hypothetical protein EDB81DRAFT_914163 [Dactylonectria macrodidyma]
MSTVIEQIKAKLIELAETPKARTCAAALLILVFLKRSSAWYTKQKVNNHVHSAPWDRTREMVVVTGGSSGIGACIVARLVENRIKTLILDVNLPPDKPDNNVSFYQVDLSDSEAIASVATRIRSEHGNPTVLINNAGLGNAMPLLDLPEHKLRRVFDVNVIAPVLLIQQFLPGMLQQNHGHIVNIASQASFATQASNVDYACTKAAVLSLHEGLTQELRHIHKAFAVRTSVVHPTWVRTPMIADLVKQGKLNDTTVTAEEVAEKVVSQILSGYGSQIIVPSGLGWTSMIRGLPGWIQEVLRDKVSLTLLRALSSDSI